MTYSKGHKIIAIEYNPLFGKRPELYIGTPSELLKVACFSSEEKARKFEEWLQYFFGSMLEKDTEERK